MCMIYTLQFYIVSSKQQPNIVLLHVEKYSVIYEVALAATN